MVYHKNYQTSATYFLKAAGYKYKDSGLQYGLLITGNHGVQFMISKTKQYFLSSAESDGIKSGLFDAWLLFCCQAYLSKRHRFIDTIKHRRVASPSKPFLTKRSGIFLRNHSNTLRTSVVLKQCIFFFFAVRKRNENQPVDFIKYIKQAAEADQTSSQYEYSVALFNGIGVEQNVRDWTNFIIKAADKR